MYSLLALSLLLFGIAKTCSSDTLFVILSILSRLGDGLATSLIISTLMAMISAYYDNSASYISAEVFGVMLGAFLGPLWGGLLFRLLGYTGIFVVQSATIFLFSLLLCYFRSYESAHPPQ